MESTAAAAHSARARLLAQLEPRDRRSAVRAATALLVLAAAVTGVAALVAPPTTGGFTVVLLGANPVVLPAGSWTTPPRPP